MLQDAIGDQRAVVVLYRGAWCPCCAITLRTYPFELLPDTDLLEDVCDNEKDAAHYDGLKR